MIVRFWQIESQLAAALLLMVLLSSSVLQAQRKSEQLAAQSADAWLVLVDSGKYADSWRAASQFFKDHVTRDQWESMLGASRDPLGKMVSRKLKSATYTTAMPGAPDGEYVVIQYDSRFEHKQSAVETVTPMLDKDGKWRVSGYFIK